MAPLQTLQLKKVAQEFIHIWISRFGVPSSVTTDREQQWESALWSSPMQLLGCKRIRTTPYHPIANGTIKHFRQLKCILKSYPNSANWTTELSMALLGIRTTVKQDFHCTLSELVYGTTLRIPGEFVATTTVLSTDQLSYTTELKTVKHPYHHVSSSMQQYVNVSELLQTYTHVFVQHDVIRKPPQTPYDGPYEVLIRNKKHQRTKGSSFHGSIEASFHRPHYIS
ncbi:uncharacterized protein [Dysidea avara]|uniref:uncharacterized protein n=1 Tax=Dysidea avara TaxID=196820 RepID=UPI00332F683E